MPDKSELDTAIANAIKNWPDELKIHETDSEEVKTTKRISVLAYESGFQEGATWLLKKLFPNNA